MRAFLFPVAIWALCMGCTKEGTPITGLTSFRVEVISVNGESPPSEDEPLPANRGDVEETWDFTVEALDPEGNPFPLNGVVRVNITPGAVLTVGDGDEGRNIELVDGVGSGTATVTAVYGPARLWIEDLGYLPAESGEVPTCSNGVNDDKNEDVLIDYPADPGCYYANDMSEEGGAYAIGVSQPIYYELPTVADVQGYGSTTPYPYESLNVKADSPQYLVVTRVSSDGFYVTDVAAENDGYNHMFAFNFSTPGNMRVCDHVTYLSGTVNEFYGYTELSFPSYEVEYVYENGDCMVPEPALLGAYDIGGEDDPDTTDVDETLTLEKNEAGLVRIQDFHIAANLGPELAIDNVFGPDQTNCDFNGDGEVDYESETEGSCSNACASNAECSEWTSYTARGNYKVSRCNDGSDYCPGGGSTQIQVQTSAIAEFDPTANHGLHLDYVTGTLRNFSGGSLNWTIETRCSADLLCNAVGCQTDTELLDSNVACVSLRTESDNDEGTN